MGRGRVHRLEHQRGRGGVAVGGLEQAVVHAHGAGRHHARGGADDAQGVGGVGDLAAQVGDREVGGGREQVGLDVLPEPVHEGQGDDHGEHAQGDAPAGEAHHHPHEGPLLAGLQVALGDEGLEAAH